MRRFLFSGLLLAVVTASADAQTQATTAPPRDSLYRRARRMVNDGNGVAGRALVDSLLSVETEGTTAYGDALYWRGALAATAKEAEPDYRRVIVEYPLSYYAGDALLGIAGLEQARGDRAGALQHMIRYVREYPPTPASASRSNAALGAARLALEQRDQRTCAAMIGESRTSLPANNIELKNQIDYWGARCPASALASDAAVPTQVASAAQTPPRDSVVTPPVTATPTKPVKAVPPPRVKDVKPPQAKPPAEEKVIEKAPEKIVEKPVAKPVEKPVAPPPAAKPAGIYTIQLAAFNTLPEAERLVAALGKKDVAARVSGAQKPFRVRLQFYPTRQAAAAEVAALKARGIISFVTTEEPVAEKKTP